MFDEAEWMYDDGDDDDDDGDDDDNDEVDSATQHLAEICHI